MFIFCRSGTVEEYDEQDKLLLEVSGLMEEAFKHLRNQKKTEDDQKIIEEKEKATTIREQALVGLKGINMLFEN